jgi:hypothetical protein
MTLSVLASVLISPLLAMSPPPEMFAVGVAPCDDTDDSQLGWAFDPLVEVITQEAKGLVWFERSPKGSYCSDYEKGVISSFLASSNSTADADEARDKCEAFCNRSSTCNACSVNWQIVSPARSPIAWSAIPSCGAVRQWAPGLIAGDVTLKTSARCLSSAQSSRQLTLDLCDGSAAQHLYRDMQSFKSDDGKQCVEVEVQSGSTEGGALISTSRHVRLAPCTGAANQQFTLLPPKSNTSSASWLLHAGDGQCVASSSAAPPPTQARQPATP